MNRKRNVLLVTLGVLMLGIILLLLVLSGLRIYCPINLITGLNCPGCGNTRALLSLLRLDFKSMFYYNLLFPLEIGYLIRVYFISAKRYIIGGKVEYRPKSFRIDIAVLAILLVWTVIRNTTALF